MSDLISREELLKAFASVGSSGAPSHVTKNYIQSVITNAPAIEQGEAVTKLWESLGRWSAYLASNGEQAELSPPSWLIDAVKNATTPQQPQSVADALEEAAKICDDLEYTNNRFDCAGCGDAIRAIIKRNAVKEGE